MRIYLDHAATTPLHPAAAKAMRPWQERRFGNPSSLHAEGLEAKKAIDAARETLSQAAGCLFGEFLFTGSGTEAANMALVGTALSAPAGRRRILISAAEHHCVLHVRPLLERLGFRVEAIPVDRHARVDLSKLAELLDDRTLVAAAMQANNELGTFNNTAAIAEQCRKVGALFFCDAVQTFPVKVADVGADLMSVSAHKLGGPKGVGGLFVRAGVPFGPLIAGGGQERDMRGGTENVAGIVGFAAAVEQRLADSSADERKTAARAAFVDALRESGLTFLPTTDQETLPGHLHLRIPGVRADSMLIRLDRLGIAASSGAACSSGSIEPSHVLLACGFSEEEAQEGLRFTFGSDLSIELAAKAGRITADAARQIASLG